MENKNIDLGEDPPFNFQDLFEEAEQESNLLKFLPIGSIILDVIVLIMVWK